MRKSKFLRKVLQPRTSQKSQKVNGFSKQILKRYTQRYKQEEFFEIKEDSNIQIKRTSLIYRVPRKKHMNNTRGSFLELIVLVYIFLCLK